MQQASECGEQAAAEIFEIARSFHVQFRSTMSWWKDHRWYMIALPSWTTPGVTQVKLTALYSRLWITTFARDQSQCLRFNSNFAWRLRQIMFLTDFLQSVPHLWLSWETS